MGYQVNGKRRSSAVKGRREMEEVGRRWDYKIVEVTIHMLRGRDSREKNGKDSGERRG